MKNYQEKADNQLLLIEGQKLKIRKNLYILYYLYLNRLRSEIFNFINKAVYSLNEQTNKDIYFSKKEIKLLINNEIKPLINARMPFITIEQLRLTKCIGDDNLSIDNQFSEKDLDLDRNTFFEKDNNPFSFNISSSCQYYKFAEDYELNTSIDLDGFNFEDEILYESENFLDKFSGESINHEKIIKRSLTDFEISNENKNYFKDIKIFDEISNLFYWSDSLDFSLSSQLMKITCEVNNILFLKKIIKKKINYEFLEYISDNDFLITNPSPFVNLFDLNNNQLIIVDKFVKNVDFSKIYFFNLNITEMEFFDMNLNILRNKISDLKYQFNLLVKKEKYWNNKKLYTKQNKSIINKI